jgi:ribosomal protein S18 acetylase RimI-like enzyme
MNCVYNGDSMECFKRAAANQLQEIDRLYNTCKQDLLKKHIYQWGDWGNNYPGTDFLKKSIQAGELYIMQINNELVGAVVLNEKQSPEWNGIAWSEPAGKSLVIHALVIDPKHQNKGFGKKLLLHCEAHARRHNYNSIRLDAFKKNDISNRMYQKYGYKNMGVVLFDSKPEDNKEYYCYEKSL